MKRFDMDNTGCPEEDVCGNWVDADIAQELYDALKIARDIMVNEQFYSAAKIMNDAMKRADKGE